ncbi:venom peptide isomerase heavy chain-like [Dermacentor albipictus]|uniref:venom peptide isomerase heavy chain-like n=1 Tax=Dermacentor albipictus TaxID=60249 RepID=UPI0038FC00B0
MGLRTLVSLIVFCCISGLSAAPYPYKEYCQACVPRNCGRPRDPWDLLPGRTYGGANSTRGRFPWHAIIYADGAPIGGGALISCNFVLTTAYLVQDYPPARLQVKLGKTNLDKESPTERTYGVFQRVLHPSWDPEHDLYSYDLALLHFDRDVDFASTNGFINAVCLPEPRVDAQGWLTLTGFGYDDKGRRNNLMKEVQVRKLSGDQCPLFKDKPYAFCGLGTKAGACTGDRGSPVVQMTPTGQFTLVGLANDYQCQPGGTDVYTQISFFNKFVCRNPVEN